MRAKVILALFPLILYIFPNLTMAQIYTLTQTYTVTDLGPLSPTAINTWGQVVGNYNNHAYMWTKTAGLRDLGLLTGGSFSYAAAINDRGTVVGTADGRGTVVSLQPGIDNLQCSNLTQPFVWTHRTGMQGLGTVSMQPFLAPYGCSLAFYGGAINGSGQVVGNTTEVGTYQYGFLWTHAAGMVLFGGTWPPTFVNGISKTGKIIGQNNHSGSYIGHSTWWKDGVNLTSVSGGADLGSLGGGADITTYASAANGINDRGQIVGWSTIGPISGWIGNPVHAVLWTKAGAIRDLGTLFGDTTSSASKINLFGQVVGSSGNTLYDVEVHPVAPFEVIGRAFIWSERSGMRDLNTLIPSGSGWALTIATDINVWGQIVGQGTRYGKPHGFLLTPRSFFQF